MKTLNLLPVVATAIIVSDPQALTMLAALVTIALFIKRRRLTN